MNPAVRNALEAVQAPPDVRQPYDLGFYALGYERRSRYVASELTGCTRQLCGFEYDTDALAIGENRRWASDHGVIVNKPRNYRTDEGGHLREFVRAMVANAETGEREKRVFVDVSSMDRSLLARLLASTY
jgi:hypothetical protein